MKTTKLLMLGAIASLSLFASCSEDDETMTPTPAAKSLYEQVGGTTLMADKGKDIGGNTNFEGQMIETGRHTLRAVVDSTILVVAADAQLAKYFPTLFGELGAANTTGLTRLSENFTDFMCVATGSKNAAYAYGGLSMKAAHDHATNPRMGGNTDVTSQKANAADFDKFAGDILSGLDKNGVNKTKNPSQTALVDALVALVYTTKGDIAQR